MNKKFLFVCALGTLTAFTHATVQLPSNQTVSFCFGAVCGTAFGALATDSLLEGPIYRGAKEANCFTRDHSQLPQLEKDCWPDSPLKTAALCLGFRYGLPTVIGAGGRGTLNLLNQSILALDRSEKGKQKLAEHEPFLRSVFLGGVSGFRFGRHLPKHMYNVAERLEHAALDLI